MENPFLSIIIPAYNEAERIPKTLLDIDHRLSDVAFDYEIIVVNDGSKDNTAEVVNGMMKMVKKIKLIDNKENKGKGGVVKQGMLSANGDIRLFMDADNSTSVDQFINMMPFFSADNVAYDVVIGSRALKESVLNPSQPLYRQIPGKLGNLFIQILLLWGISDTQCGFKAFKKDVAIKIFSISKINGWGFDVEILALAKKFGYKIKEIPVHWMNDEGSKVKMSSYFKVLIETLKIRYFLWVGKYDTEIK
jgi:dolichyl-phosphate beta-glucosyltransferase